MKVGSLASGSVLGDCGSFWRSQAGGWWTSGGYSLLTGPSLFTCFLSVSRWVASATTSAAKDYELRSLKQAFLLYVAVWWPVTVPTLMNSFTKGIIWPCHPVAEGLKQYDCRVLRTKYKSKKILKGLLPHWTSKHIFLKTYICLWKKMFWKFWGGSLCLLHSTSSWLLSPLLCVSASPHKCGILYIY